MKLRLPKISAKVGKILHVAGIAAQYANFAAPFIPNDAKVYVAIGIGAVQGAIGAAQQYSNPDGTPAEAAWVPKKQ